MGGGAYSCLVAKQAVEFPRVVASRIMFPVETVSRAWKPATS